MAGCPERSAARQPNGPGHSTEHQRAREERMIVVFLLRVCVASCEHAYPCIVLWHVVTVGSRFSAGISGASRTTYLDVSLSKNVYYGMVNTSNSIQGCEKASFLSQKRLELAFLEIQDGNACKWRLPSRLLIFSSAWFRSLLSNFLH